MKMVRLVTALALFLVPSATYADVINGNFQTGDFSGWTISPDSIGGSVIETSFAPTFAADVVDGPFLMSQTISTTPGQQYQISFSLFGDYECDVRIPSCTRGGSPNGTHVTSINPPDFNDLGATFGDGSSFVANLDFAHVAGGVFEFTGVASGNLTTLTFLIDSNVPSDSGAIEPLVLTDISIAEINGAPESFYEINPNPFFSVPEPTSGSIFGAALLGLIISRSLLRRGRLVRNSVLSSVDGPCDARVKLV